jgi:hypothetical protein
MLAHHNTDGDAFRDGAEVNLHGTDPTDINDAPGNFGLSFSLNVAPAVPGVGMVNLPEHLITAGLESPLTFYEGTRLDSYYTTETGPEVDLIGLLMT